MILDLFAGPGGWSEGLRMLGLSGMKVGRARSNVWEVVEQHIPGSENVKARSLVCAGS